MAGGVGLGLTLLSTAMTTAAQYQQGRAQEAAYQAQANIDEQNAKNTALETSLNEDTLRKQNRQNLAKILAAQGEAGLSGGTASNAYLQSFKNAEQDALNLRYQGATQWQNYKNSASMNRYYGRNAKRTGTWGALASGISGTTGAFLTGANNGWLGSKVQDFFFGKKGE